jgi:ankyrin repeat protein
MYDNGINFYDDLINFRNINLIEASKRGYTSTVSSLLENGHDVNMKDSCNETALLKATMNGHDDIVEMLLEKGADVNSIDDNCYTVLMWACLQGHTLIVSMLLDKGVDVNARTINNETALIKASCKGDTLIVKLLLEKGADVNAKSEGRTALMWASRNRHIDIVTLIENHIRAKLMKERIMTALIIKKGLTQNGDTPLLQCAHRETIYRIASFF